MWLYKLICVRISYGRQSRVFFVTANFHLHVLDMYSLQTPPVC